MKIILINTLYYPNIIGGAERSVQLLAEKLQDAGHTPIIICTSQHDDKIDEVNGIKVYYLQCRNLYWGVETNNQNILKKMLWHSIDVYNPLMKKRITEVFKQENPDVIHTNTMTGFSVVPWLCAKELDIPVVHTLRDFNLMCPKNSMFKDGKNCEQRCGSCAILSEYKKRLSNTGYVDHLVGNSTFMIERHQKLDYFQNVKSSTIFNGTKEVQRREREARNPNSPLKFLYIGRIAETKGVTTILDAFQDMADVELQLAGKVYDPVILERQKDYPDHIKFLGFVNPDDVLPNVDLVIVPSLYHEPLPRVIFEAYSYGLPVIGSNRGGIPEIIHDGKTGYIYDPDNKESLIRIILDIKNNPNVLDTMSHNMDPFLQKNSLDDICEQYIQVYESLRNPAFV